MAQKTGQEETEFKAVPETLNPCVNNCGVTGNPSTNNMCQNCFNSITTATTTSVSTAASSILSSSTSTSASQKFDISALRSKDLPARVEPDLDLKVDLVAEKTIEAPTTVTMKRVVNRCSGCKRKVGLTGFRCRCGELFCSEHRYSDRHDCNYDYKAAGREAIARENPLVRAAKIVKV